MNNHIHTEETISPCNILDIFGFVIKIVVLNYQNQNRKIIIDVCAMYAMMVGNIALSI